MNVYAKHPVQKQPDDSKMIIYVRINKIDILWKGVSGRLLEAPEC